MSATPRGGDAPLTGGAAAVNRLFGDDAPLAGSLDAFAPHTTVHERLWGRVELLPLVEPTTAPEPVPREALRHPLREPRLLATDDRYLREGRMIAAQIRALLERGDEVRVLDNFSTGSRGNLAELAVDVVEGELRSYERVHNAVRGVEVVFHLGALGSVSFIL